jgi:predicted metal-binding protein
MIHAQRLGDEFWAEAVCNAVYVRNWCPTKADEGMTPEEAWSERMPHVSHMRVFGCVAYAKVPDQRRTKFDAKGVKCLFLGYCEGTKGYLLFCLKTKKIIKSPDVVFFKDKTFLEDCPSGSINEAQEVKVDISPKSKVEASGDISEPNIEDESEAEVPAAKSTRSMEASKLNASKKTATKPPPPLQYDNETIGNTRYPDRPRKPLGEWWKNHIPQPQDDEHANMAIVGEPRNLREALESSDASEWELVCRRNTNLS